MSSRQDGFAVFQMTFACLMAGGYAIALRPSWWSMGFAMVDGALLVGLVYVVVRWLRGRAR